MKLRLISVLIFTAIITACSCGITDNDFEVPYPSSFDPVVVNESIIFNKGWSNKIVLFDTIEKKQLYIYDFSSSGSKALTWNLSGDNLFVQLTKSKNEIEKSIIIKVKISTGEVKKLDFYDDYPYAISVVKNQVWIDSCASYSPVDHKVLVYDTMEDAAKYLNTPDPIYSRFGATIDGNLYMPMGGRTGENSRFFNINTGNIINFTDALDVKFTESTAYFSRQYSSSSTYFNIFGYEIGTTKENYTNCLYKIDSLSPISVTRIIKIVMDKPLGIFDAFEFNNSLYVLFSKTGENIPPQTALIRKYTLDGSSFLLEKEINDGGLVMDVANGSFWMAKSNDVNAPGQMYEINPDTLEYTLR